MKIVFRSLGPKKFSKIVEVSQIVDPIELCKLEIKPHLPEKGEFEMVPTDGLPDFAANSFTVVHTDVFNITRGMGDVVIYR